MLLRHSLIFSLIFTVCHPLQAGDERIPVSEYVQHISTKITALRNTTEAKEVSFSIGPTENEFSIDTAWEAGNGKKKEISFSIGPTENEFSIHTVWEAGSGINMYVLTEEGGFEKFKESLDIALEKVDFNLSEQQQN